MSEDKISDDDFGKFQGVLGKAKAVVEKEARAESINNMSKVCSSILSAMIMQVTLEMFILCLYRSFENVYIALSIAGDIQSADRVKDYADRLKDMSLKFYKDTDGK